MSPIQGHTNKSSSVAWIANSNRRPHLRLPAPVCSWALCWPRTPCLPYQAPSGTPGGILRPENRRCGLSVPQAQGSRGEAGRTQDSACGAPALQVFSVEENSRCAHCQRSFEVQCQMALWWRKLAGWQPGKKGQSSGPFSFRNSCWESWLQQAWRAQGSCRGWIGLLLSPAQHLQWKGTRPLPSSFLSQLCPDHRLLYSETVAPQRRPKGQDWKTVHTASGLTTCLQTGADYCSHVTGEATEVQRGEPTSQWCAQGNISQKCLLGQWTPPWGKLQKQATIINHLMTQRHFCFCLGK
jgi:hypothetical protein